MEAVAGAPRTSIAPLDLGTFRRPCMENTRRSSIAVGMVRMVVREPDRVDRRVRPARSSCRRSSGGVSMRSRRPLILEYARRVALRVVPRIVRTAGRAVAADDRNAERGAGAEKAQLHRFRVAARRYDPRLYAVARALARTVNHGPRSFTPRSPASCSSCRTVCSGSPAVRTTRCPTCARPMLDRGRPGRTDSMSS